MVQGFVPRDMKSPWQPCIDRKTHDEAVEQSSDRYRTGSGSSRMDAGTDGSRSSNEGGRLFNRLKGSPTSSGGGLLDQPQQFRTTPAQEVKASIYFRVSLVGSTMLCTVTTGFGALRCTAS